MRNYELVMVLTENFFRGYRGRQGQFVAVVKLGGDRETNTVSLGPADFETIDGEPLATWKDVDLLSLRAYFEKGDTLLGSKRWAGAQPTFGNLRWGDSR